MDFENGMIVRPAPRLPHVRNAAVASCFLTILIGCRSVRRPVMRPFRLPILFCFALCLFFMITFQLPLAAQTDGTPLVYPKAKTVTQVDDYHGAKVADPYRWLENLDASDTRAWIESENKLTSAYIAHIPGREKIRQRLTEIWNYERTSPPEQYGGRYFFTRN